MIDSFRKEYRFLSNFFPAVVWLDRKHYVTVEHAYQASKTLNKEERRAISACNTPGQAKRLGRRVTLREDWNEVKLSVMSDLVAQKFEDPTLRKLLLATGKELLIEGNTWNDTYWGMCRGVGANHLGKILMEVRAEARAEARSILREATK